MICSEVSILSWACANTIYKYDDNQQYYASAVDNLENPNEGYSWMIFDTSIEKSVRLFEDFKHNLKIWSDESYKNGDWTKNDVRINYISDNLRKES